EAEVRCAAVAATPICDAPPKRTTMDNNHQANTPGSATSAAIDPVCGMQVDPAKARGWYIHEGQTYYFCCPSCLMKFRDDPQRYIGVGGVGRPVPSASAAPASGSMVTLGLGRPTRPATAAVFTCPMDPEVRQDHPGSCPKCSMALEPALGAGLLT